MKNTALLIIDVQQALFTGNEDLYNARELIDVINKLISKARTHDIPIIFVQHNGEGEDDPLSSNKEGWLIHPEILIDKRDIYINKNHPDSFQETTLKKELDTRGIQKIVIAGLQTEYCIDTTCRRAYSLGYEVILVEDAHSTYDTECLKAKQIIDHHNQILSNWFVKLINSSEVSFSKAN
jgi:nicotinamidase-related amidase